MANGSRCPTQQRKRRETLPQNSGLVGVPRLFQLTKNANSSYLPTHDRENMHTRVRHRPVAGDVRGCANRPNSLLSARLLPALHPAADAAFDGTGANGAVTAAKSQLGLSPVSSKRHHRRRDSRDVFATQWLATNDAFPTIRLDVRSTLRSPGVVCGATVLRDGPVSRR